MSVKKLILCLLLLAGARLPVFAQNLPSLLTDRNINSTFSIVGYDSQAQEWGVAVATNNIYVGNSTCYVEPGLGVFSVIAETEPLYAINGFAQLRAGKSIREAIFYTKERDSLADQRQVSGIDAKGEVFAFTGSALRYWKGTSMAIAGKYFVVMGNQLAPGTLQAMAGSFQTHTGTLAERLLAALIAGEHAGGQISGKQSAALLVRGTNNEWFNNIDLRVDHSRDPFGDLRRLLNYHYGRIRVNQATYALDMGNSRRGDSLLTVAVKMTRGWYGMYPKIAKAYILAGNEQAAVHLILATVRAEPKWKANLSAFYCLYHHPGIRALYPERRFNVIDWNNAVSMLIDLHRTADAIKLAASVVKKYPDCSYSWYLLAKARQQRRDSKGTLLADQQALKLDTANADAKRLLKEIIIQQ